MSRKHPGTRGPIVPLTAFAVVMVLILAGLIVVFSEYRSGDSTDFNATFTDVSKLEKGDKVRIAGVEVGRVKSVDIAPGNLAEVKFSVDSDQLVYTNTKALVRYENLTGDRYLALTHDEPGGQLLEAGGMLPVEQTEPALDLDALLGGFKPLLNALNPEEVNRLSSSIIAVFQGEGGNVQQLLAATASVTQTLANRDELIGSVIDNLNTVLGTVADNKENVDGMVDDLQVLISGLSANADPLAQSVERISDSSATMTDLLTDVRPPIQNDIAQLDRVSTLVNNDEQFVDQVLGRLPSDFEKMARLGAYGSFFNFYLCGVIVRFTDPASGQTMYAPQLEQTTGRCSL